MLQAIRSTFGWKKKTPIRKISLGICAMDRKAKSKPMREILQRLPSDLFDIIVFGDDTILGKPIEQWPVVEALISFYSTDFPIEKALEYVKLRSPFIFNDLKMDSVLKDRRKVYELLRENNIDVPNHVYLSREDPSVVNTIEEYDEYVVINGVQLNKPLVEKPINAEDHNIYIYYPVSAGGGSKRLFRKVKNVSSEFFPDISELRTEGSYIYEEFLHTQGTDVKVYTVGAEYGHAEARKSPVVDGKVNRDSSGFEVRYPVILTPREKEISRKIVEAFQQTVCGFDILRVQGKSYVCDVNGFSFVKNSRKYFEDASQILMEIMLAKLRPGYSSSDLRFVLYCLMHLNIEYHAPLSTRDPLLFNRDRHLSSHFRLASFASNTEATDQSSAGDDAERASPNDSLVEMSSASTKRSKRDFEQEELRCVISVIRHGDRTPKQKMKVVVTEPKYLEYYHFYSKSPYKDLKVKSKSALVKFLAITGEVIESGAVSPALMRKFKQIKDVLERWEISGFNRKLQMKPQKWTVDPNIEEAADTPAAATELLVILKWGGDLTPLGRIQAEKQGEMFRQQLYPHTDGGGVLRLHSTYRHDLKIKASDEGRVMKTAAAFTKGLLELEGQLTPILVSLVTVEEKNRLMLDRGGNNEVRDDMNHCKKHLNKLQIDEELTDELIAEIAPGAPPSLINALKKLNNPLKTLWRIYELIEGLCKQLEDLTKDFSDTASEIPSPLATDYESNQSLIPSSSRENLNSYKLDVLSVDSPGRFDKFSRSSTVVDEIAITNITNMKDHDVSGTAAMLSSSLNKLSENDTSDPTDQISTIAPTKTSIDSEILNPVPLTTTISFNRGNSEHSLSIATRTETDTRSVDEGLYLSETFTLMSDRWQKLYKDFYSSATNMFDLTKIPDVYDMIRYDCLHNHHIKLEGMEELFRLSQCFENSVVPQEYGIDKNEKRLIGSKMCGALLEKIKWDITVVKSDQRHEMEYSLDHSHGADLAINSLGRLVRTRLYFTSESHLHTLLNVLRYPSDGKPSAFSPEGQKLLDETPELSYLTQVIFRLFEDRVDPSKFRCEILFSPGATSDPMVDKNGEVAPLVILNRSISCEELLECLERAIEAGKLCQYEELRDTVDPMDLLTSIHEPTDESSIGSSTSVAEGTNDGRVVLERKLTEKNLMDFTLSSTPSSGKRNQISETVVTNSELENNDQWEASPLRPVCVASRRRPKGSIVSRDYGVREVQSRGKVTSVGINATIRSQSPNGPITNTVKKESSSNL